MKRFYVLHKELWRADHYFNGVAFPIWEFFENAHYIDLHEEGEGLILMAAKPRSAEHGALFHAHAHVGRLPHPLKEPGVFTAHLHSRAEWAHKNYTQAHHEAIVKRFELPDFHNVWHLHERAKAIHPLCCLDEDLY